MSATQRSAEELTPGNPRKELRLLFAFFGDSHPPKVRFLHADQVPSPAQELLVHHGHMTETLELYHGAPVAVHPYEVHQHGDMYGRKLDLTCTSTGEKVMTGLMLFNLSMVRPEIRAEIIAGQTPLGRILIHHGVLREVSTGAFFEVPAMDPSAQRFGLEPPLPAYGRLATIYCDGEPAVDLIEIVCPRVSSTI